jgi:hypothetical protein
VSDGVLFDQDTFTVHVEEADENRAPIAKISVAVHELEADKALTLDGTGSSDPDGDSLEMDWDFNANDGIDDWVRGPAVVYSWEEAGIYTVTLRVSDGKTSTRTSTDIKVVAPAPPNVLPKAEAGYDVILSKGATWTFHGAGTDPDGTIVAYEWDLDGDGKYDTYSETDGVVTFRFEERGYFTLWLRVTDDDGSTAVDSVVVTVKTPDDGKGDAPGLPGYLIIMIITLAAILVRKGRIGEHWPWYKD